MKTILATLGAFALATTAAYADGDGGKARNELYAVARGDYNPVRAETQNVRTGPFADIVLRREVVLTAADARQIKYEALDR